MLLADRVAIITVGASLILASKLAKYGTGVTFDVNCGMQVH